VLSIRTLHRTVFYQRERFSEAKDKYINMTGREGSETIERYHRDNRSNRYALQNKIGVLINGTRTFRSGGVAGKYEIRQK
jgi:hypothetical protein